MNKKKLIFQLKNKVSQLSYGTSCTSTSQCRTSLNLTCSTYANQCQCPNSYTINTCDCLATQYYDNTLGCCKLIKIIIKIRCETFGKYTIEGDFPLKSFHF